jgi:hypothetical protein
VRGHADAETLAAFHEELLPRRKAGQVAAHLATCPRCAALDAQLAEVTALLTHATAPPMPDALTTRIEAALAAEAAARSAARVTDAAPAVPAGAGMNGTPDSPAHGGATRNGAAGARGRRTGWAGRGWSSPGLRIATVAAAVAVVAGGGYTVAQLLSGSPGVRGSGSSSALAPASSLPGASKQKRPVFSGPANGTRPSMERGAIGAPSAATAPAHIISSNTDYEPGHLGAQASAVIAALAPNSGTPPRPTLATPPTRYAPLFPNPQGCVAHVANGQHPLLVDEASYQGHPAMIIVLPATHGAPSKVLVIAPGCTSTTAHVLATATLPTSG